MKLGLWRHYKGGTYRVLGVVRHSETLEPMVMYKPDPPRQARVRVLLPATQAGVFLMEYFDNPKYPASLGKCRFPGGGIQPGETAHEAALRELREEFGLIMTPSLLIPFGSPPPGSGEKEFYFIALSHWLKPGSFTDSDSGDTVTLIEGNQYTPGYIGPDLRTVTLANSQLDETDAWVRPLAMWEEFVTEGVNTPVKRFSFLRD